MNYSVVITDASFGDFSAEKSLVEAAGGALTVAQCQSADEVIAAGREADALLVQWAPITREVLQSLKRCKVVVRYGIGVDNVDVAAARECGIAVCNVPDYGIDEVADHAVSLALCLGRQLVPIDARVRSGVWKLAPVAPMLAFREMTFATAGFGRIGRAVLERARGFKFRLASYDPFVNQSAMADVGVTKLSLDELFAQADILSLHLPLAPQTEHLVNAERLAQMKPNALVVNTARGALVDTLALARALEAEQIGGAGLDVFESEPLPADHPIRHCPNAILTSHVAWYSESSGPLLQRLAAGEVVRALRGEPLKNQIGA